MTISLPPVTIYTDGACIPNPGSGGWAAIILFESPQKGRTEKTISGSNPHTTSIRMELQAAIEALKALKRPCFVNLITDSRYLYDGINNWLPHWKNSNWHLVNGGAIKNVDLWKQLAVLLELHHVEPRWTKGHSNDSWNQKVDLIARSKIELPQIQSVNFGDYHLFIQTTCVKGTGGWGVILRHGNEKLILSGTELNTTANRMEIVGAIEGLWKAPKNIPVHIYTRNNFIYSSIIKNVYLWKNNGWRTSSSEEVKHRDLWEQLLTAQEEKMVSWYLSRDDQFFEEFKEAKEKAVNELKGVLNQ